MTFKEKHFRQAFGPLLLSALMTLPAGCGKNAGNGKDDNQTMGLLDPTPVEMSDKYGVDVVAEQVEIPVYDKKGKRLEGQWVLTHGLPNTKYEPDTSLTSVRMVHINDNPNVNRVKVDANNAVLTDKGVCGLFVEDGKIVLVSDASLRGFISENNVAMLRASSAKSQKKTNPAQYENTSKAEITDSVINDESVTIDTIGNHADTLMKMPFNKIDTLQHE